MLTWLEYGPNIASKSLTWINIGPNPKTTSERGDKTAMVWSYYSLLTVVAHFLKRANMKDAAQMFIITLYV